MATFDKFRPYLSEFLIFWNTPAVLITIDNGERKSLAELLNTLIRELSEQIQSDTFKTSIRQNTRGAEGRIKSAQKYLLTLRNENPSLIVICADLIVDSKVNKRNIDESNNIFDLFKRALGRTKRLSMKGFIWKLERGFDNNFYYHCIFFLEAHKDMTTPQMAELVIELWNKKLRDQGYIPQLSSQLTHFKDLAVGHVDSSDDYTYEQLFNLIRYHCKKDQFIVHKSMSGEPTFATGRSRSIRQHLGRRASI
ncbi:MAG: inovirus Gp2 family protein [Acinetobacter sp.]|nr:MAG: inovirus Gp2 family protein [Acinetobacter sp.]